MTTTLPAIDWRAVKAHAGDLRRIVEGSLPHAPRHKDYFACPFHAERTPSLRVWADHFHCFGCGVGGDAIDWIAHIEGVTRVQAAKRLDPSVVTADDLRAPGGRRSDDRGQGRRKYESADPGPAEGTRDAWRDPDWQRAVEWIVEASEECLWSPMGEPALDWLRGRGLDDHTIRRFRLGFNPVSYRTLPLDCLIGDDGGPVGFYVARGVTMPWLAPGACHAGPVDGSRWVGLNVRVLADPIDAPLRPGRNGRKPAKTLCLRGSRRGHLYPWPDIDRTQGRLPVLIVEGEFDALIGFQEASHAIHVLTAGGASTRSLPRATRAALARVPAWLICTDHDAAGVEAARWWRTVDPHKARRVILPRGKDLSDFIGRGGDVLAWLESIEAKALLTTH